MSIEIQNRVEDQSIGFEAPLQGLLVIDVSDQRGAYAGRVLGDLGAKVIKVQGWRETRQGSIDSSSSDFDARGVFNDLSKVIMRCDDSDDQLFQMDQLLKDADIVITDLMPNQLKLMELDQLVDRFPHLIHLSVSPWGLSGPGADQPATDLTILAAGGLLGLAGEPLEPPVRPYAEQSSIAASLHGVVGALISLLARDGWSSSSGVGHGQLVDVSAQEAIACALENAAQYVDLQGLIRHRTGAEPSEAGSGLFKCADGFVYLVAGIGGVPLAWDGLIAWIGNSGSLDLSTQFSADRWRDREWRRTSEATNEFRLAFESFASEQGKVQLCEGGQAAGVSISPVSTPADLFEQAQLVYREFFREIVCPGGLTVTVPGAPYRFDGIDIGPRPTVEIDE